jgi:hypothetical protein
VVLEQTGSRTREAVLEEWNHRFGWELQLMVDGELVRSHKRRDTAAMSSL